MQNGLAQYISSNPHLNYSDYTTINGALQIAATLNVEIGRTAITNLISSNKCCFRIVGSRRGQCVVNVESFRVVLKDKFNV